MEPSIIASRTAKLPMFDPRWNRVATASVPPSATRCSPTSAARCGKCGPRTAGRAALTVATHVLVGGGQRSTSTPRFEAAVASAIGSRGRTRGQRFRGQRQRCWASMRRYMHSARRRRASRRGRTGATITHWRPDASPPMRMCCVSWVGGICASISYALTAVRRASHTEL